MRRYVPLLIAGAALIAAACRDAISPSGSSSKTTSAITALSSGQYVSSERANPRAEAKGNSSTFTLSPFGGFVRLGAFVLSYPANAVCDPNRSGYGPTEWNKPCPTLGRPITIRVKTWVQDGVAYSDFDPNIRFDPAKRVSLTTFVTDLRDKTLTEQLRSAYAIGYTTSDGTTRFFYDEAASDPAMATYFWLKTDGTASGFATRRIYHFSGYYVRSGKYCDELSLDPECSGGMGLY